MLGKLGKEGSQLLSVFCFNGFGPMQGGELKMKFLSKAKIPEGL